MIGWTAVLFSIQSWLSETPAQTSASSTPGYFSVGMALLAVGVVSLYFIPLHIVHSTDDTLLGIRSSVHAANNGPASWSRHWNRNERTTRCPSVMVFVMIIRLGALFAIPPRFNMMRNTFVIPSSLRCSGKCCENVKF